MKAPNVSRFLTKNAARDTACRVQQSAPFRAAERVVAAVSAWRFLALPAMIALLAGCPTPTQYGGPIAVDTQGFAARMQWLCRWGMQGAKASACLAEAQQPEAEAQDAAAGPQEPAPAASEGTAAAPAPPLQEPARAPEPGNPAQQADGPSRGDRWCSSRIVR